MTTKTSEVVEMPTNIKAITIIRNHLDLAVSEINDLLQEEAIRLKIHVEMMPVEAKEIQHFPTDLAKMLDFHDEGDWLKVSPKTFLVPNDFGKVLSIVRELGGEYVSAGKNSHFKVPKKEMKQDG